MLSCQETLRQLDKEFDRKNQIHLQLMEEHKILQNNYAAQQSLVESNSKELILLQECYAKIQQKNTRMQYELEQKTSCCYNLKKTGLN